MPVLVVAGSDDRVVPKRQTSRIAAAFPNSEHVVIPRCGHQIADECPRELTQVMGGFIERTLAS